jgi:prepilin peptidase CpaA
MVDLLSLGPVAWSGLVGDLAFMGLLGAAAIFDIGKRRIPNVIPLLIVLAFAAVVLLTGVPPVKWPFHLLEAAVVLVLGLLLFSKGLLGGGDVKLLAASTLWYSIDRLPTFLFVVSIAGGVLALAALVAHGVGGLLPSPILRPPGRQSLRAIELPYAVAIAAGGILVLPLPGS